MRIFEVTQTVDTINFMIYPAAWLPTLPFFRIFKAEMMILVVLSHKLKENLFVPGLIKVIIYHPTSNVELSEELTGADAASDADPVTIKVDDIARGKQGGHHSLFGRFFDRVPQHFFHQWIYKIFDRSG
jgi:hypothetical protein